MLSQGVNDEHIHNTAISVYNTILFIRQARLVEKQTLLQRSQVYPYVKIEKSDFTKNTFAVTLKNVAETPAFALGLRVHFVPCSKWEEHWQFVDEINYPEEPEMKKGYPIPAVIPLKNENAIARIYGKETEVFKAEPLFMFKNRNKKSSLVSKVETFDRLKKRLLEQRVRFVAVMLSVVYKDVAETVTEFEHVKDFVIDFQKHENLKQAFDDGIPFYDKTIGYEETTYVDYDFYQNAKGYRGRLEP